MFHNLWKKWEKEGKSNRKLEKCRENIPCNRRANAVYSTHKWGIVGVVPLFVGDNPTVFSKMTATEPRKEVTGVTGQYAHNIDAKGRLFIPAKLREELGETFHVTIGQDGCLSVFSDAKWASIMEDLKTRTYSEVKALRPMFANAADCEPDGQGRILIPALLRSYASLEKEVVVVGSFDRVEIWNAQRWAELEAAAFDSGALEKAMEELGL